MQCGFTGQGVLPGAQIFIELYLTGDQEMIVRPPGCCGEGVGSPLNCVCVRTNGVAAWPPQ
jgi:hypothetical protein